MPHTETPRPCLVVVYHRNSNSSITSFFTFFPPQMGEIIKFKEDGVWKEERVQTIIKNYGSIQEEEEEEKGNAIVQCYV